MGAGQCIDGVWSMPAAVWSFHRHVRGIATRAPAAATKCATGRPNIPATCPQIALPREIAPKNAVTNIARPRPRTHSGSATWAETLRLDKTAIQDTPAMTLADRAMEELRASPNSAIAIAVPTDPAATSQSGPSFVFSQGNAKAPLTAPAPIAPSRKP